MFGKLTYLFFGGTAEAAIEHYTRALGAESEGVMRYADMPAEAGTCAPEDKQRVMHASLRIGAIPLMLSDVPHDRAASTESNVEICLDFDDPEDMARRFEALGAGGTIGIQIHDAFWGGKFGTLTDKFGVRWMLSCDPPCG
jgi:PhnB protein